jgi:hypothetical protein
MTSDKPNERSPSLRKTHQVYREYNITTLNPQWDETFYLPLPCPKSVISSTQSYEEQCEELLKYWGSGNINIQIVDGERFNEEIFLGEVSLLLSTLLVPSSATHGRERRKHTLEATGSYSLNKLQSTDRVSGSLQLHAYIHLPDPQYLHDILHPAIRSSSSAMNDMSIISDAGSELSYGAGYDPAAPVISSKVLSQQTIQRMSKKSPRLTSSSIKSPTTIKPCLSSSPNTVHQPAASNARNKRMSMIADVSKCLTSLSHAQHNADVAIDKMNSKLDAKHSKSTSRSILQIGDSPSDPIASEYMSFKARLENIVTSTDRRSTIAYTGMGHMQATAAAKTASDEDSYYSAADAEEEEDSSRRGMDNHSFSHLSIHEEDHDEVLHDDDEEDEDTGITTSADISWMNGQANHSRSAINKSMMDISSNSASHGHEIDSDADGDYVDIKPIASLPLADRSTPAEHEASSVRSFPLFGRRGYDWMSAKINGVGATKELEPPYKTKQRRASISKQKDRDENDNDDEVIIIQNPMRQRHADH